MSDKQQQQQPLPTINISKNVRTCETTKVKIDVPWRQTLPAGVDSPTETILLIPGQNANLHAFELPFCQMLADRTQYRVISMDNRDSGQGTHFDAAGQPWTYSLVAPSWMSPAPAYYLTDMAADCFALMDSLKIDRFHVAGVSMGGMIAQWMAIVKPERVLSLSSLFSSPGGGALSSPPWWVRWNFLTNAPSKDATLEQLIEWKIDFIQAVLLPVNRTAEENKADRPSIRARCEAELRHSSYREGGMRQVAAILHTPNREEKLKQMKTRTLCVAGKLDNLFQNDHHERFKQLVPHAEMLVLPTAGHYLEARFFDQVSKKMAEHVLKKENN